MHGHCVAWGSDDVDFSWTSQAEGDCCTEFLHFCFTPISQRQNVTFPGVGERVGGSLTFSLRLTDRSDSQLLLKEKYLHINSKYAMKSGEIISYLITGQRSEILGVCLQPHLTKQCSVSWLMNHAEDWHQVSESHNWPRVCRRTHSNGEHQMSSMWGTCKGKGCGLHGITIPAAAVALKGICGKLIGQTDNSVTVIFPDSQ